MVLPFLFPAALIQLVAGLEEAESLAGEKSLRLIQILFADFAKNPASLSSKLAARADRRFKFRKGAEFVV